MPRPATPFVPKSNAHLLPGDWWAVPLKDGRFAAGRVLARQAFGPRDRTGVTIALLDWVGTEPPTEDDITGRPVLAWALSRVETIAKTGGEVLGNRSLDADDIGNGYGAATFDEGSLLRTGRSGWRSRRPPLPSAQTRAGNEEVVSVNVSTWVLLLGVTVGR